MNTSLPPRGRGTRTIFGYRWATEGLKPITLFRTTPSILLPCLGQRTKCTQACFRVIVTTNKIQIKSIVQADRLTWHYIPCLRQTSTKLYTQFRTERSKTIPCQAAHPRIGHIGEYPPNPPHRLFTPIRSVHDPLSISVRRSFAPKSPLFLCVKKAISDMVFVPTKEPSVIM